MTHWNDVINQTAVLTLENASTDNRGIYSASYVGDSPLKGAWMRLIVRGLLGSYIYTLTTRNANTQPTNHALKVRLIQEFCSILHAADPTRDYRRHGRCFVKQ